MTTSVKALKTKIEKLGLIGTQMSNLLYNWKQDDSFTANQKQTMGKLVRQWDAVVRSEP